MMNKIMKKIILCCILVIYILNLPITAFASVYMFSNLTVSDGLTQGTINVLYQDSKGYIWIGTQDGLNRYNGYDFKEFNKSVNKKNSLVSGYIMSIAEDKKGNLWVGTIDGISKIDLHTCSISNYNNSNSSLPKGLIADIEVDNYGTVFIAAENSLLYYNEENNDFLVSSFNIGGNFKSLMYYEDYLYGIADDKIFKYDKQLDDAEFIFDEEIKNVYNNDKVNDMYIKDGIIVFGTRREGVFKYNMNTNKIESLGKYTKTDSEDDSYKINKVFIDSYNNIFAGSENGLIAYNHANGKWIYTYNSFDKYTIADNNVLDIMQDESGMIWVGTESGISTFETNYAVDYYYNNNDDDTIMGNIIQGIYESSNSRLWVGSNGQGVSIMNKNKKDYDFLNTETKNKLSSNAISDITGNDEKIFVSTDKGINVIDIKTYKVDYIIDGLKDSKCNSLYLNNDNLYVSTYKGVNIINIKDYSITDLDEVFETQNIKDYLVGKIFKDSEGILWIGLLYNGGLIKYNEETKESKLYTNSDEENSISDNSIYCINEDSKGNMWFGTSVGINKLDKKNDKFTVYSTEDGLSNNTIYSVIFDNNDRLWISNNSGIERVDIHEDGITVKRYAENNEFNRNSYFKLASGWIAFGSSNGLFIVNPEHNMDEYYKPELKFDSFKFNGIDVKENSKKTLNHKDSYIYLKLFTTYYKDADGTKYFYKINDENSEWILIEGNEFSLSKLQSGKYNITFRALSSNGVYSDEESISFEVLPPLWRSKIAIFIYTVAFIGLILFLYKKIKEKDDEIEVTNDALNNQMKEKNELLLKVLRLERRKNNYLINMSHELRTPLNIIYSVQQLVLDLNSRGELSQKEVKKYMEMSGRNIHRLLKLINDLIDSTKIDSGNFNLFLEEHDLVYVVEEAVLSFKSLVDEKGINLIFDTEIEECIMNFDENAIERCILNIVNNAIKFTNEGGEILVNIFDLDDKIKIEISDTGCGIPKENINDIFDRFSQVINSKRELTGGSGSGLGLTITKRIIELHKGEIFVTSEVNKGSTFTIILPKNIKIN